MLVKGKPGLDGNQSLLSPSFPESDTVGRLDLLCAVLLAIN